MNMNGRTALLKIPFIFGLGPHEPPITATCELWAAPLPVSRLALVRGADAQAIDARITYGDYFSAAREFIEQDHASVLCRAVSRLAGRRVELADVARVEVFLVKHGAFYHPARIRANVCDRWWSLVLNVAVSASGRAILEREFENLERLNQEMTAPYWPQVFGRGSGRTPAGRRLPMFLGQWLDGFHEFHLSARAGHDPARMIVWDEASDNSELTPFQVRELLRQAALILAYAYNPLTLEAILDWHHAAGDFVVNLAGVDLSVRLISVRRYAPMAELDQPDVAAILDALLVYLVDISLRLRIDRSDGIGHSVCHPVDAVSAICLGFFQGLQSGASRRDLPEDFVQMVRQFCALHDKKALLPIVDAILTKYSTDDDAKPLLQASGKAHAAALAQALARQ
jgi:hypothetical protein